VLKYAVVEAYEKKAKELWPIFTYDADATQLELSCVIGVSWPLGLYVKVCSKRQK